ncbi:hypothetical protein ASF29_13605 [Rhizobium sp. Leaf262]|nr:hypothetical protein ASF29_13605 [Rhizobium sp. Leaf262]
MKSGKMKDIALYFKNVQVPEGFQPSVDLKKVIDFKEKCIAEKKIFFKPFNSVSDFKEAVVEKLQEIGWAETAILKAAADEVSVSEQKPQIPQADGEAPASDDDDYLLGTQARNFLRGFLNKPDTWDVVKPEEVARFRLLASSVRGQGNDDAYLGNHDANIIFRKLKNASFSGREILALIDCGVNGFQHQNVPLWCWLTKPTRADGIARIATLSLAGTNTEKQNALELFKLVGYSLPFADNDLALRTALDTWLIESTNKVFEAAVSYLSAIGKKELIPFLEKFTPNSSRFDTIQTVIVSILSRTDKAAALKWILEKSVDKVDKTLIEELFSDASLLNTELIKACLDTKPDLLRLRAAETLHSRNELDIDTASTLLTDTNYDIRIIAIEVLRVSSITFDEKIVSASLKIERPGFGLLKSTDDTFYRKYKEKRLDELSYTELKALTESSSPYTYQEKALLYSKYTKKCLDEIRTNLEDGFESYVLNRMQSAGIDASKLGEVEHMVQMRILNIALNALCNIADAADIRLVRRVLRANDVEATSSVLSYLSQCGNWSDVELIKELGQNSRKSSLLSFSTISIPQERAEAILALGRNRIADIFALDVDNVVKVWIAKLLPKKVVEQLSDEVIIKELQQPHGDYRVMFALKCLASLKKSRFDNILTGYLDGERRFYNAIHWLDLGVSYPSSEVKKIATRQMASL